MRVSTHSFNRMVVERSGILDYLMDPHRLLRMTKAVSLGQCFSITGKGVISGIHLHYLFCLSFKNSSFHNFESALAEYIQ